LPRRLGEAKLSKEQWQFIRGIREERRPVNSPYIEFFINIHKEVFRELF